MYYYNLRSVGLYRRWFVRGSAPPADRSAALTAASHSVAEASGSAAAAIWDLRPLPPVASAQVEPVSVQADSRGKRRI